MTPMPPRPFEKPDGTIDLHYEYLRFGKPNTDTEYVFAFPRTISTPACIKACQSLVPEGFHYLEHDDGYGRPQTKQETESWRRDMVPIIERLSA